MRRPRSLEGVARVAQDQRIEGVGQVTDGLRVVPLRFGLDIAGAVLGLCKCVCLCEGCGRKGREEGDESS